MLIGTNVFTAVGLIVVVCAMLIGLFATYPAVKAFEKGRSFVKWYLFGFFLFPVAFIASFYIKEQGTRSA